MHAMRGTIVVGLLVAAVGLVGLGCSEGETTASPQGGTEPGTGTEAETETEAEAETGAETGTESETEADPGADDPLAELAAPPSEAEVVEARPTAIGRPTLAAGVCAEVAEAPLRVLPRASAAELVAAGDRFYLAAYEPLDGGREQVSLVELVAGQAPRLIVAIPVAQPVAAARRTAAPALALVGAAGAEAQELGVAFTDAAGHVLVAFVDPARPVATPADVGMSEADLRFSPALARVGPVRVVAATIAVPEAGPSGTARTAMRLHLARLDPRGAVLGRHDVTPVAGAGAHPTFVRTSLAGAHGDLLFVDPRVALSVIHRVRLDAEGTPGETTVGRPINLSAEPPSIASVRLGERELAAYAATGNMATRAVGLVELGQTEPPQPLVPGLGYGQPLTVRAIARASDAVFATEAPSAVQADAPHEVRVRTVRVDAAGARTLGEPLVLPGATRPALAIDAGGVIAIAVEGGLVRFVRCGA
jgi:hypothetical protein